MGMGVVCNDQDKIMILLSSNHSHVYCPFWSCSCARGKGIKDTSLKYAPHRRSWISGDEFVGRSGLGKQKWQSRLVHVLDGVDCLLVFNHHKGGEEG